MIVVVSTGFASPKKEKCLLSVRGQHCALEVRHEYVEASVQSRPTTKLENLRGVIGQLRPHDIVALVDGDDWLADPTSLQRVAVEYANGAWVTWGSFECSDGRRGFAADVDWSKPLRSQPWVSTHLKTFRAGLFQRIDDADLKIDDEWIDRCDDPAFMWPIIEMAGRERCRFIPDVLYVYNEGQAWHRSASGAELAHQARIMAVTRSRPPYARVEEL